MADKKLEIQSMSALRSSVIPWLRKDIFLLSPINILWVASSLYYLHTKQFTFELFSPTHIFYWGGGAGGVEGGGFPTSPSEMWITNGTLFLMQLISSSHWRLPLMAT